MATDAMREAKPYRLAVSLGASYQRPGDAHTMESLLALADERMYAQKAAARAAP
jgi:GGDEF domain-containing protein